MTDEAATNEIMSALAVTREDIARAKVWLLQHACGQTRDLVEQWLSHQKLKVPKEVHTDLPTSKETLAEVARVFSVRLAFYQAIWELVNASELIPAGPPGVTHNPPGQS